MKALITNAIVLTFTIGTSFGQNYQTFQSDEIHYFSTQTFEYYLASQTLNIDVQGADSVFYSYKSVRENESLPQGDPCKYYLGDSWLGERIEIKADGRNIFYNKEGDAITIQTQAAVNDTFLLYTYPNGDWIRATVTNQVQVSILGELDQVKIYELFSNISFPYSNDRLMLSENHGIIETFAFYNFPEPYDGIASISGENFYPIDYTGNFRLVGIDTSGFHKPLSVDLYDYEIGDVYKVESQDETLDLTIHKYKELKIVNKFVWPGDSIVYFIEETIQEIEYPHSGSSVTNIWGPTVKAEVIIDDDEWVTPNLPEAFNGTHGWTVLIANECGDIEEIVRTEGISYVGGTCLDVDLNAPVLESKSINGVGFIGLNGSTNGVSYSSKLVYYEKPYGVSCGVDQVLSIREEVHNDLSAYPNPFNDVINLRIEEPGEHIITVVDKSGKVVRVWKVNETGDFQMNLEGLEAGVYVLMDETFSAVKRLPIVKT